MEKRPTLMLLNFWVYQAPESVMMNQRVHLFSWFGPILFYRIKARSCITAECLQWTIYVKTKRRVYIYIKKISKKLSRPFNPSLGKSKSLSFIFVFYPLLCASYCYSNTALAVKGYYKCRFFNVPKVIGILIIMKTILFILKQSGWLESTTKDCRNPNL